MNAERQLVEAYGEWRHLAEIEGEAIGARDWMMVAASQTALRHLQERISSLSPTVREEWSKRGDERVVKERGLTAIIHELIGLERRNQTLLNSLQEAARLKLNQLDQAGRNLKRIQRSYGSTDPTAWTSFS